MKTLIPLVILAAAAPLTAACSFNEPMEEVNTTGLNVNVPVVSQHVMVHDFTAPVGTGLSAAQRDELREWLDSIDARYGDRISVDQGEMPASYQRRIQVERVLNERGLELQRYTPVIAPAVSTGATRVVVVRAEASVPGCPDQDSVDDLNWQNATSSNFGCATNSGLAQMIADPNDLISGKPYLGSRQRALPETGPDAVSED